MMKGYERCTLCPNRCGVDRTKGRSGICGMSDEVMIAWSGLHRGEEPPITGENGSGMIFFSGCPLHCRYCQNIQISGKGDLNVGYPVSIDELSILMLDLERMGASTLNLVTGTHFIPSIIEALLIAKEKGLSLPVVWNSSGYEDLEALALIDPYIDIYLLDCKSLDRKVCSVFCGREQYADVIIPVMDYVKGTHPETDLEEKMRGVILRHLVFPGTLDATFSFLSYYAAHYKDNFFLSLMVQFVPPKGDLVFEKLSAKEYDSIISAFEVLGIEEGFIQEQGDEILWIPDFTKDNPFPHPFSTPNDYFLSLKHR